MNNTLYSFAEAMNIVGNGGCVNRTIFEDEYCLMLDKNTESVAVFVEIENGKIEYVDEYVPTIDDIKAQDWYLREKPQPKDTRTNDEIEFDEEVLAIKESLETMGRLSGVDGARFSFYYKVRQALETLNEGCDCLCEEPQEVNLPSGASTQDILEFVNVLANNKYRAK